MRQKKNRKEDKISQQITADTVFIKNLRWQDTVDGIRYTSWNKVFIDSELKSRNYDRVLDFSDMNTYLTDYDTKNLKHFDTSRFPDDWVPLYKYNGKYYVYAPGDSDTKFVLRDSLFISYFWEPQYFAIDTFKLKDKNQYRLITNSPGTNPEMAALSFDIFMVDPANNIAVWKESGNKSDKTRYFLMIAKENARKFPIIINDANEKPEEFIFDPINFPELLGNTAAFNLNP